MPMVDDSLRQELIETNEEFRTLYEEHQASEKRLDLINQKSLPSQEDELEAKNLKRHKLFLKDRMEAIVRSRREQEQITA